MGLIIAECLFNSLPFTVHLDRLAGGTHQNEPFQFPDVFNRVNCPTNNCPTQNQLHQTFNHKVPLLGWLQKAHAHEQRDGEKMQEPPPRLEE